MEDNKLEINCRHGKGTAAIVCGHLLTLNQPLGFIENSSDPDDLQGWCYACEYFFQQEEEMNDQFKAFNTATCGIVVIIALSKLSSIRPIWRAN